MNYICIKYKHVQKIDIDKSVYYKSINYLKMKSLIIRFLFYFGGFSLIFMFLYPLIKSIFVGDFYVESRVSLLIKLIIFFLGSMLCTWLEKATKKSKN